MVEGLKVPEEVGEMPLPGKEPQVMVTKQQYEFLTYWATVGQTRDTFWLEALKNPEGMKTIKDGVKEIINPAIDAWTKTREKQFRYSLLRMGIVILLLVAMTAAASWLASMGKLDSSSLIFLFGTITGYMLTFLTKIEGGNP